VTNSSKAVRYWAEWIGRQTRKTRNLYGSNRIKTKLNNGIVVQISEETDYPWSGRIRIRIEEGEGQFSLHLRIPSWARDSMVRLNGRAQDLLLSAGSYVEIHRSWHSGDIIDLELPMAPRLIEANPYVEETLNQVAVQRGPLIYCLESTDLPTNTPISIRDVLIPPKINLVARYDRNVLGGIVLLEGKALFRRASNWNGRLYRELELAPLQPFNARFIPYFTWANRGPSEMTVWAPLCQQ